VISKFGEKKFTKLEDLFEFPHYEKKTHIHPKYIPQKATIIKIKSPK
jgi:hypothetical protein